MKKLIKSKRGQIISSLVAGIAGLVILVIVSFLIVDTLNGAGLIDKISNSTWEESVNVNSTGTALTACDNARGGSITSVTSAYNETPTTLLTAANYSTSGCLILSLDPVYNNTDWNVTYTYELDGASQNSVDDMLGNYSEGIGNVSGKIPTVLLIAAVVLLFGAIVFLVQRSRAVTVSSGGGL